MTPIEKEAIRMFAVYGTPQAVFKELKKEYGDDCPTAGAVTKMKERFRAEILKERKALSSKISIMDPTERWYMLQTVFDSAMEGDTMMDRAGNTYQRQDRVTALNALKVANDLTQAQGAVHDEDDEYVRNVTQEAYKDMKSEFPDRSDSDLLNEILANLGEQVRPYVDELRELVVTESKA